MRPRILPCCDVPCRAVLYRIASHHYYRSPGASTPGGASQPLIPPIWAAHASLAARSTLRLDYIGRACHPNVLGCIYISGSRLVARIALRDTYLTIMTPSSPDPASHASLVGMHVDGMLQPSGYVRRGILRRSTRQGRQVIITSYEGAITCMSCSMGVVFYD